MSTLTSRQITKQYGIDLTSAIDAEQTLQSFGNFAVSLMKLYSAVKQNLPAERLEFKKAKGYYDRDTVQVVPTSALQDPQLVRKILVESLLSPQEFTQMLSFEEDEHCTIPNHSIVRLVYGDEEISCINRMTGEEEIILYSNFGRDVRISHDWFTVLHWYGASKLWEHATRMFRELLEYVDHVHSGYFLTFHGPYSSDSDDAKRAWSAKLSKLTVNNWMTVLFDSQDVFQSPQFQAVVGHVNPGYKDFLRLTEYPLAKSAWYPSGRKTLEDVLLEGTQSTTYQGSKFPLQRVPPTTGRPPLNEDVVSRIGSFLTGRNTYRLHQQNPLGKLDLKGGR